jgi:hypothetical protein
VLYGDGMADRCADVAQPHVGYQRRRPERSVLWRIVSEHIETLWAEAEARSEHGFGYPNWIKKEFERYTHCGLLSGGFTRIRCRGCGCERLVAFSCKCRICPSCCARRMADVALHLTDFVMPIAAYRQWTLTFPYALRLRLARQPELLSAVLSDFLRTVFCWQRLQARRAGIKGPLCGAVTAVQLWGSLLQLTPHFHCLIPDGVFSTHSDGSLQFHRLEAPQDADVDRLLQRIAQRVLSRFDPDDDVEPDDNDLAVTQAQAESLQIVGLTPLPVPEHDDRPLCSVLDGFTLHADRFIAQNDRAGLRRAIRYGLRPPISQKRLGLTPDGKVSLQLRKPLVGGRTHLVFEPLQFLRRLAASIPRPRQNMLRFHGLFAPNASARPALAALVDSQQRPQSTAQKTPLVPPHNAEGAGGPLPSEQPQPVPKPYRRPWAELLAHVLDLDVLQCPRCDGTMVPVQTVKDPAVIQAILQHLDLPTTLPAPSPSRGPPQQVFDFDQTLDDDLFDIPFDADA